jgi:hypothetical protein
MFERTADRGIVVAAISTPLTAADCREQTPGLVRRHETARRDGLQARTMVTGDRIRGALRAHWLVAPRAAHPDVCGGGEPGRTQRGSPNGGIAVRASPADSRNGVDGLARRGPRRGRRDAHNGAANGRSWFVEELDIALTMQPVGRLGGPL